MTLFEVLIGTALLGVFALFLKISHFFEKIQAEDRAAVDAQKDGTDEENTRVSLNVVPGYLHTYYLEQYRLYRGRD